MKVLTYQSIILSVVTLFFSYCFAPSSSEEEYEDITGTQNANFTASIRDASWEAVNTFYTAESQRIEITAVSTNYETIMLKIMPTNNNIAGDYILTDSTNQATLISEGGNFISTQGTVTITTYDGNKISGEFSFTAKNTADSSVIINVTDGVFEDVLIDAQVQSEGFTIPRNKLMLVDANSGEVQQQETYMEVSYTGEAITVDYVEMPEKSFTIKVKSIEKNGANIVILTDDSSVEVVTIDAVNKNQITVWYKNGNTLTLY